MSRHLLSGKNNNSTDIICISVKYDEWKMNRVIDVKLINPYNNCILGNIIFHQYLSISIGLVDQMGLCFYRLRCEVFQNLILRLMNTGFVRPAVATVLTVYGIETNMLFIIKLLFCYVATALTVTVLKHWIPFLPSIRPIHWLQQDLLFTICRERCEIIEEKSDNGCAALYLD